MGYKSRRNEESTYDPLWGPLAGQTESGHDKVPYGQGANDAATNNLGQNTLVRLPGSAKALTIDGSAADIFPIVSDPDQVFPFYFKSIEIIDFNLGTIPFVGDLNFTINEAAMFQATISMLRESIQPQVGTKHYFGRSEPIRTYQYTERKIDLEFTVYAPSFAGLQHVKERINFLVKSCYPTFEGGAVGGAAGLLADWVSKKPKLDKGKTKYKEPPIMMLTVGDLFVDLPGMIETLDIDWVGETNRWEMERGLRMPQLAKITMTYVVLHKDMPERTLGADFYPKLYVDELYAVQGEGGSMARGQKAQTARLLFTDLDKGEVITKLGQLAVELGSGNDPFNFK